jgi:peptidase M23-like protein
VRSGIWIRVAVVAFACSALHPAAAWATGGDLFPPGTGYCASTYGGHPRPFPTAWWGPSVDINRDGGDRDRPVLAPADGKVLVWTTVWLTYHGQRAQGWGNSVVWISADGHEQVFVAHLDRILTRWPQQRVRAGQVIALSGNTGEVSGSADGGAHLHVNRMIDWRPAPVVLSGRVVVPSSVPGSTCHSGTYHYISMGPLPHRARCRNSGLAILSRPTPFASDPDGASHPGPLQRGCAAG